MVISGHVPLCTNTNIFRIDAHHQPAHSLLLNALILFLLLTLSVGVVGSNSFSGLLDLGCDGAVVLLKVLSVLQDAVEVFLSTEESREHSNTAVKLRK